MKKFLRFLFGFFFGFREAVSAAFSEVREESERAERIRKNQPLSISLVLRRIPRKGKISPEKIQVEVWSSTDTDIRAALNKRYCPVQGVLGHGPWVILGDGYVVVVSQE